MAVPAKHVSKTRQRKRRSHWAMSVDTLTKCPNCGEAIKPHRVCKNCGFYKGEEIIKKEEEN